jgi:NADPH:quinone reductase-like Zn-dependent oxidoreductase
VLAVQLEEFGSPDGLRPVELPAPVPGTGQVRVDLVAAALNRRDYWIRVGGKVELPVVLGSDGAGVVSAVGPDVTDVEEGDEVVINPSLDWGPSEEASGPKFRILGVPDQGTYAEQVVVDAHQVRPRPQRLSWLEAAALPLAGLTAWRVLATHAEAGPGRTILIPGAGGGVATFLIQIGAALGARMLVTTGSEEKLERARQLGAEGGVLYTDEDWPERVAPVDAIADGVGAPVWDGALRALRPGGRLVNFGDTARETAEVALSRLYFGYLRIQGTTMGSPREFDALLEHVTQSEWRPVIDSTFALRDAASAHARLEHPDRFGKVVLVIDEAKASLAMPSGGQSGSARLPV